MLQAIDHINIVVSSLEESTKFYVALGFEVEKEDCIEGEWISKIVGLPEVKANFVRLKLGSNVTRLELIQYLSPVSPPPPPANFAHYIGFRHMAFTVSSIEDVVSKLKANNVSFFSDVQTYAPTNKKLVYFYGPDNVILEFAEYSSCV